ncbi:MAG: hypothetical protein DLM50_04230 [Candidatus Meridianibacter frigidus]|nr:MAG: hypothetical protein DLM50_04230 [Candidatus Eremiobacteraeota bacterium]
MKRSLLCLLVLALAASGCSSKNKFEKEADKITNAVIANNMDPVRADFDSQAQVQITRVRVARLSDELNSEGKFQGVKERPSSGSSAPNTHYFNAPFEKHVYEEKLVLDDDGKVREWDVREKASAPAP